MNTPICDFVREYEKKHALRLHMPGHKGEALMGFEKYDITEIDGADVLYDADGIIKESQQNAAALFGTKKTLYSTEGSSLCIRAMLYLVKMLAKKQGRQPLVFAGRNAHKVFMTASALLDIDVEWLSTEKSRNLLSCEITADELESCLCSSDKKPIAVYITSPDYLGNISDIRGLSEVCDRYSVLLLVDNAHGAYLNFLEENQHPIHLGAHMCCDSAHKTLPALTGAAYLHIAEKAPALFCESAELSMRMFASTSPSYLILQSLDMVNSYLSDGYKQRLSAYIGQLCEFKKCLTENNYVLSGDEPLKITLHTKDYGYAGEDFHKILKEKNIVCEFYDKDFCVFMLSPENSAEQTAYLRDVLLGIERREKINELPPVITSRKMAVSMKEALLSEAVSMPVSECEGRILASPSVSCPPAVPLAVCGERITKAVIECFEYYGIENIFVLR